MESWYFAYGSNLWIRQMEMRTGAIDHLTHPPRIAHLENHRLVFQHLDLGGPAYANILTPGDGVLGVLYRCNQADLERLDHYERGYDRQIVAVTDQKGETFMAIAYVIRPTPATRHGKPSAEYLQRIVNGATQHGLPERYVETLVAVAAAGSQ